jgi:amino acid transporter
MGRSGVLPTALGKVNPTKKTPVNSIHLEVAVQVVAFVCVLIWGASNVFLTWANAITIGLVVYWGLLVFFVIVAVTIVALIYMRVTHKEEWMVKAQLVFEESGTGHQAGPATDTRPAA